jgi:hypothetical protein
MRRISRLRPSPAMLVASLALFVALGGVGYAALNLPTGSVKSKHLAAGSVKKSEIAGNAVGRRELASAAVTSGDVANGSLRAADLASDAAPDVYSAYLQPQASNSSISVGWQTRSFDAPTLTYIGPGHYRVVFERTGGIGCAVPAAMAFDPAAAVTFRVSGLGCTAQETSFQLLSSNGQDVQLLLQVAFT